MVTGVCDLPANKSGIPNCLLVSVRYYVVKWLMLGIIIVQAVWGVYLFVGGALSEAPNSLPFFPTLNEFWSPASKGIAGILALLAYLQQIWPPPREYEDVIRVLSMLQERVFTGSDHGKHINRVTLFKFVKKSEVSFGRAFLNWHTPSMESWWGLTRFFRALGSWFCSRVNWLGRFTQLQFYDGFLVAVARSREKEPGQIERPLHIMYGVPSHPSQAEGVAGMAWATPRETVAIFGLPCLTCTTILSDSDCDRQRVDEYARRGKVSVDWVRARARRALRQNLATEHIPVPSSLVGFAVRVAGEFWGVIVFDSQDESISTNEVIEEINSLVGTILEVLVK